MACFLHRTLFNVALQASNGPLNMLRCLTSLSTTTPTVKRGKGGIRPGAGVTEPREFFGCIRQVKASPKKMNMVARLIRGMRIRDALAQLEFCGKKSAKYIKDTILDTQRRAVDNQGASPLNLYVVESYVGKGSFVRRIRYHGKGMHGIMHLGYAHYFLILREGSPPPKKKKIHNKYLTRELIQRGPLTIPNSL